MAETAVIHPPLVAGNDIYNNNLLKASKINDLRIASVMFRMRNQLQNSNPLDSLELFELCLSLARGIDFCVANQQIPPEVEQLPLLLKQMCQPKHNPSLIAAIMVLMISVKSAIQSNWFPEKDAEELCRLMNEMGKHFSSSMDLSIEPSCAHPIISTIMSRFYPRMKMGQILFLLEAKPGFGAYVNDFRISKQLRHTSVENVRLLVARTDNADTSTCLITPPQVNFLLNGKGVGRRVNVSMEAGPQMPTNVTAMLKFGTNLLQAIGDFNGSYIIVMAFVSETSTLNNLEIQDYVQPAATLVDPDSDLIEGPSRISLNCPISFKRIKTPVKGHSCKHHQCFDYNNYVGINSKKPSWRCPICNSHVCFTDIRVDQNMAKVLSDIGENVNDVIISSDGSWTAIMEGDDHLEKLSEKFSGEDLEMPDLDAGGIVDLTELDDQVDSVKNIGSNDRKVSHAQDDFWSGVYFSTFPSQTPNDVSDSCNGITPDPSPANVRLPPVSTDVIALPPNWDAVASTGNALVAIPGSQNESSSPTGWHMQQYQYGDVAPRNEYGRSLPMPRHITRKPNAVQALPAQPSNPGFHRPRSSGSTWVQPVSKTAAQANAAPLTGDGFPSSPGSMERITQFSRSHANSQRASQMAPPSLPPHLNPLHNQPRYPVPQSQQYIGIRVPNPWQQPVGQFQSVAQPRSNYSHAQGVQEGLQQHRHLAAAQRAAQVAKAYQSSSATHHSGNTEGSRTFRPGEFGGGMGSTRQPEGFEDMTGGNWRPNGRMRGSLSGQAYSAALSQYTLPETQQSNRGAPSIPSATSSQLQILIANRAAALQEANFPSTGSSNMSSPPRDCFRISHQE